MMCYIFVTVTMKHYLKSTIMAIITSSIKRKAKKLGITPEEYVKIKDAKEAAAKEEKAAKKEAAEKAAAEKAAQEVAIKNASSIDIIIANRREVDETVTVESGWRDRNQQDSSSRYTAVYLDLEIKVGGVTVFSKKEYCTSEDTEYQLGFIRKEVIEEIQKYLKLPKYEIKDILLARRKWLCYGLDGKNLAKQVEIPQPPNYKSGNGVYRLRINPRVKLHDNSIVELKTIEDIKEIGRNITLNIFKDWYDKPIKARDIEAYSYSIL